MTGPRAPLNNAVSSQRGIKHSYARRALKLMALVLGKKHNNADGCFSPRPKGLTGEPALFVVTFWRTDVCRQSDVSIAYSPVSLRANCVIQRCPSNSIRRAVILGSAARVDL